MTGVASVVIAGLGAAFAPLSPPGADPIAEYQHLAAGSATLVTDVDVSRNFDRKLLEEQAEAQAVQRERALQQVANQAEQRATELEVNQWVVPVVGYRFTSPFGYRWGRPHTGIDLAAPTGTPIVAVAGGVVVSSGFDGGYGLTTIVRLEDGTEMLYAHQSSASVNAGQQVHPGQRIGAVGNTGFSTGPHLHFEIHLPDGTKVDPVPVLARHGVHVR